MLVGPDLRTCLFLCWVFDAFSHLKNPKQTVLCFTFLTGHCYCKSFTETVEFVVFPQLLFYNLWENMELVLQI